MLEEWREGLATFGTHEPADIAMVLQQYGASANPAPPALGVEVPGFKPARQDGQDARSVHTRVGDVAAGDRTALVDKIENVSSDAATASDIVHPVAEPRSRRQALIEEADSGAGATPKSTGLRYKPAAVETTRKPPIDESDSPALKSRRLAQFQLPPSTPGKEGPAPQMPSRLTYQYSIASESVIEYRRDRDLDRRLKDNSLVATPELNGIVVYRPTDWLETTLEAVIGKEFPLEEQSRVTLPSGEIKTAPPRHVSLVIDQAYVKLHKFTDPFEFAIGRRNYEDERHWIYDTSMDVASVAFRQGRFRAEFMAGRETWVNLDLAPKSRQTTDRIDTYMLYADYRFENAKVAGYTLLRDDRAHVEGRPLLSGVRALGSPSDRFNYWLELAHVSGKDASSNNLSGYGFDVGFTQRWPSAPHLPSFTLGYAFGSGDGNPSDKKNHEFRQSGLQANETRFAGISQFKIYGEVFDPELSNLGILTVGVGFRPTPNMSVDLVYHRYRLDRIVDQIRNSALTAEINQIEDRMSKDIGSALDVVIGIRRLFGVRRLGMDLRVGWFLPGNAFLRNDGTDRRPNFQAGDKGFAVVTKIWY
jgi:alginate production protein